MKNMRTKYFRIHNNTCVRTIFDPEKRQITLYNDDFTVLGIGLY